MIIAGNVTNARFNFNEQLESGKAIYIYGTSGTLYDFYMEQELQDVYALVYFYGSDGVLKRNTLNLNFEKTEVDKVYLLNKIKDYFRNIANLIVQSNEFNGLVINVDSEGSAYTRILDNASTAEFPPYGYIVINYQLYRALVDDVYFYRMETMFQFTPGYIASQFDNQYDVRYKKGEASISLEGSHIMIQQYHSGSPKALDYWPKNAPDYRTITSSFNLNLTIGRTQRASINSQNGYGVSVDSTLSSTLGLGYSYQETYTQATPVMSSQFLPYNTGGSWFYNNFDRNTSALRTFTSYPGMLFEITIPSNYPYYQIGGIQIEAKYKLWRFGGITTDLLNYTEFVYLRK